MIVSHWMAHPGGSESRMFRLVGVPLWEPTRMRAVRRGVAWWLQGLWQSWRNRHLWEGETDG